MTENKIEIFRNEEFGTVRTLTIDGEPYFVGKDVAEILGYSNSRKAIADHVDEEDKNTVTIRDGKGNPNQTVINESGLYSLIQASSRTLKNSSTGLQQRFFPQSESTEHI